MSMVRQIFLVHLSLKETNWGRQAVHKGNGRAKLIDGRLMTPET